MSQVRTILLKGRITLMEGDSRVARVVRQRIVSGSTCADIKPIEDDGEAELEVSIVEDDPMGTMTRIVQERYAPAYAVQKAAHDLVVAAERARAGRMVGEMIERTEGRAALEAPMSPQVLVLTGVLADLRALRRRIAGEE